jgi:hypothetical protein
VSDLIRKIRTRFNKAAAHSQELKDQYWIQINRDYGFKDFLEVRSHRPGPPMMATGFSELFRRFADVMAEQIRHARGLALSGPVNIYLALWLNGCVPVLR